MRHEATRRTRRWRGLTGPASMSVSITPFREEVGDMLGRTFCPI
jgi:hypothetical protein